jgi:LacI family transcriptional regulator
MGYAARPMGDADPSGGFRFKKPTLRDIAEALDLDVSTVSKVVNGGRISVREETRQRILDEVARRNYRPDAAARSLRVRRTGAFGLLLPDFTNPVYATIVRGATARAQALGFVMLMAELGDDALADPLGRLVRENRVDGLIIAAATEAHLEELSALQIPIVFVNRRAPGHRSVTVDDGRASKLAVDHLVAAGHRQLAFIGADDSVDTAKRRRAGFMDACRGRGLAEPLDLITEYSRSGGYDAMTRLADIRPRPTGVFASNLLVGIGALAAARARDVAVPEDVSVVTLDAEDAAYTAPPLTAVRLPLDEMAARAAEELARVLAGVRPRDVVIDTPPTLIERESVARPPASGGRSDPT